MNIETFPVGSLATNCYLLSDSGECCLIDPGDSGAFLLGQVEASGCALRCILLTHGHFDHYSAVEEILAAYPSLPVYLHEKDLAESEEQLRMRRLPEKNQRYYREGDQLTLGSLSVTVMETPGHSQGSVCLVVEDAIFSGDTLFRLSCGRTDLEGGDYKDMLRSLGRLGRLAGQYRVYPGHEEFTDLDTERDGNPYVQQGMQRF